MLTAIDSFLNRITMYRLVLYYLLLLVVVAAAFGLFGVLPYSPISILFSAGFLALTCWLLDFLFAYGFGRPANIESALITGLIIALIVNPIILPVSPAAVGGVVSFFFISLWAIASKHLLAIGQKHIFNPAAFAVALSSFTIGVSATWWVGGNIPLLPFVFLGGLLIVRKIRRTDLVLAFFATAGATIVATVSSSGYLTTLSQTILHAPLFFLAFVMLTEPATTPPGQWMRIIYGGIVGFLFSPNIHIGSFYTTPELALVAGNIFSYAVSPKGRIMLTLVAIEKSATDVYDFVFQPNRYISFRPGQYLEWTLAHAWPDSRGNRRYFTIASSPTENTMRLGVKFYAKASSFKKALSKMQQGQAIFATQLSGSFTLPRSKKKKLVFIAGGIGVTPFRSMIQYLLDKKEVRPIVMLYSNKTAADIAYKNIFDRAANDLGIRTIYAVTDEKTPMAGMYNGLIDAQLIAQEIPDYRERTFYISGPHGMVDAFKKTLREMGVSPFRIKADFFPGFA